MCEPRGYRRLNRTRVRQWLPVAALGMAFLAGAFARTIFAPLPATATPAAGVDEAALAAVPDAAASATTLISTLSCHEANGALTCVANDPDGIQEVQVFDAVTLDKVAKVQPTPRCAATSGDFAVPAARATHDLFFRVVDCAIGGTAGRTAGRDWYTAQVTGAAAAPQVTGAAAAALGVNAASGSVPVPVSGPRATR